MRVCTGNPIPDFLYKSVCLSLERAWGCKPECSAQMCLPTLSSPECSSYTVWTKLPLKLETLQKLFFQVCFQIPRKQENMIHQSEAGVEEVQDRDTGGNTQNKGSLSPCLMKAIREGEDCDTAWTLISWHLNLNCGSAVQLCGPGKTAEGSQVFSSFPATWS